MKFSSTVNDTYDLPTGNNDAPDPSCWFTSFLSMKESATKYDCIKNIDSAGPLTLTGTLFSENLVAPTDGVAEFVLDLECAEQNCASTFGGDMCRFDINCGALGIKTSDMVREMSQVRLRFVRGESVKVSASLPHYTIDFLLNWQVGTIVSVAETSSSQPTTSTGDRSTTQRHAATPSIATVSPTVTSAAMLTTRSNSAEHQASDDGSQQTIAIAIGVGAAVCVLMLIVFMFMVLRLFRKPKQSENVVRMPATTQSLSTTTTTTSTTTSTDNNYDRVPALAPGHYDTVLPSDAPRNSYTTLMPGEA